ncbi:hypothetical protein ABW20_dc0101286 [Dactylellina cionopaga]|nr:hypothetical protein ABW20_dc0101286 [Dactylellina cionopaga]
MPYLNFHLHHHKLRRLRRCLYFMELVLSRMSWLPNSNLYPSTMYFYNQQYI